MDTSVHKKPISPNDVPVQAQVISNPFPDQPMAQPPEVTAQTGSAASLPDGAGDGDLIEKSWVDATDAIVKQYIDDPYALQQKQAELSRDYLKKRFGLNVGAS